MGDTRGVSESKVDLPKDPIKIIALLKSILDKKSDKKDELPPVIPVELVNRAANAVNEEGCTPLHIAAKEGRKDIVKLLIDHKANIYLKWSQDDPKNSDILPLHLAIQNNHYEVVQTLLKKNPHQVNEKFGFNTKELSEYAIKINKNDKFNSLFASHSLQVKDFTGLHLAAYFGNSRVLLLLLTQAQDIDLEIPASNRTRSKARDLAKAMGHDDIVQIFEYYSNIIEKADPTFKKSINLRINQMLESPDERLGTNKIIEFLHETSNRINAVKSIFNKAKSDEKLQDKKSSIPKESLTEKTSEDKIEDKSDESKNYHKVFIYLINKKYPVINSKEGVCQGLAINAMLTMMQNKEEITRFNERQKYIYSYFEDCFKKATDEKILNQLMDAALKKLDEDITNIRNKIVNMQSGLLEKKELTKEEQALIEIPAFLETTAIAFAPQNFPELYPPSVPITMQDPNAAISVMNPIVFDIKTDKKTDEKDSFEMKSPVPKVASASGIYNKNQLELLLQSLLSNEALIKLGEPIGFSFDNGEHAISGMINPKTKELYFYDANGGVIKNVNIKMMTDEIFQAFNNTEITGFITNIFSKKEHSQLVEEVIQNWENSDEFKSLHAITTKTVQYKDDNTMASLLYLAADTGNVAKIEQLLAKGADPNAATKKGITPLYIAVQKGNIDVLKLLLNNNADPSFININGDTPLHMAVTLGNLEICELLIKNKADTNLVSLAAYSPLLIAAGKGNTAIVKLLLANNANPNYTTKDQLLSLHLAVQNNHIDIANLLIDSKTINAGFDASFSVLLKYATTQRKLDGFNKLFTVENKKIEGFTSLHLAAFFGHKEMVELLLSKGADIHMVAEQSGTRISALDMAKAMGHEDIVKILIAKQQDLSKPVVEEKVITSPPSAPLVDDLQKELYLELTRINDRLPIIIRDETNSELEIFQIEALHQSLTKMLKGIETEKPVDIDSLKEEINMRKSILEHIHLAKKSKSIFKQSPSSALKLITNLDELMKHIPAPSPLELKNSGKTS